MPVIKHAKRTNSIKIRVNDDELKKLQELKQQDSLAAWMRELALGVRPIKMADPNLVRELGRIGSNLNQIAKYANIQNKLDAEILQGINRIELLIKNAIDANKG